MRLLFDRGTIVLHDLPSSLDPGVIPGILWDPRIAAWRAPGRLAYPLASELRRRDVRLSDRPQPQLAPPTGFQPVALRPYQQAAYDAWHEAGRRGLVVMPTGSGKTRVAFAALAATRTPALCLVPTRALLQQWVAELGKYHRGPIGIFGDGQRSLAPITVATFASAHRNMPLLGDRFGLLIVDEAHHFGNARHDEALDMSIAPLRLGLTATPPAPGPVLARIGTLIGPIRFDLKVSDLQEDALAPFDRITQPLWLEPEEQRSYDDLRTLYRGAFSAFRITHPTAQWDDFIRLAANTEDGRRAIAAWRSCQRLLAFPRCKQQALANWLRRLSDRKTLIFVADNDTAYRVAREHLLMPLTCEIGRKERSLMLEHFRTGAIRALVSAQVLNEGIDVPDADVGIVVAGRRGEREHTQRVGRLLRPSHGKRALVVELVVQQSTEVQSADKRWSRLVA
jgi:superfamily II DNA or RNA helicase